MNALVVFIIVIRRAHGRCPVAGQIGAREFDRRAFSLQTVAHGLGLVGREWHAGQQILHRSDKIRWPRLPAGRIGQVPREQQLVRRAGERAVQRLLLHEQALRAVGFEFHAERVQLVAVHVAQQRRGRRRFGDQPVVDTEQDDVFRVFQARALDVSAGHAIERDRDGAHIVLTQHQPEQLREPLGGERCVPAHPRELLHCGDQDLPQLAVFVRKLQAARGFVRRGARGHASRRIYSKEKAVQRAHAVGCGVLTFQRFAQGGERCDRPRAQLVQFSKLGAGTVVKRQAVAVRMLGPVALPRAAADVPGQHIVFQLVHLVARQAGQPGLEAAEQVFILEIRLRCRKRTHDHRHRRAGEQIGLFREEHRHVVPRHRHGQKGGVGLNIACADHKITVARALVAHLAADVRRRMLALVKGRRRRIQAHAARVLMRRAHGQQAFLLDRRQTRRARDPARAEVDLLGSPVVALCHAGQGLDRLAAGDEDFGVRHIAGNGCRERHARGQHRVHDRELLRRKAEEAVQIDRRAVQHMAVRQPVAQMGQPVARVGQGFVAQALVGGQQLRQVAQLSGKCRILTLLGRGKQRFRCNCTGLALIHQPQRFTEQLRLVRQPLPRRKAALHAARGLLQGQQLSRRGEHLLRQPAYLGEHAVGQTRKCQYLRRARAVISGCGGKVSLHLVRVELGHEQDLPPLIPRAQSSDLL